MKKILLAVCLLFLLNTGTAEAATYYLVGSSGNWQGGTIWATSSGGTATAQTPTSADDIVFDSHSTGTVTVGTASNAHNITMTSPGAGTIIMGGTAVLNIYGSLSAASGMTWAPNAASVINFLATSLGQTVNFASYSPGAIVADGVGGGWAFSGGITATGTLELGHGTFTFDSGTYSFTSITVDNTATSITCATGNTLSSSGALSISAGGSYYNLTSGSGQTIGLKTTTSLAVTLLSGAVLTSGSGITLTKPSGAAGAIPVIFSGKPTLAWNSGASTFVMTIAAATSGASGYAWSQ